MADEKKHSNQLQWNNKSMLCCIYSTGSREQFRSAALPDSPEGIWNTSVTDHNADHNQLHASAAD